MAISLIDLNRYRMTSRKRDQQHESGQDFQYDSLIDLILKRYEEKFFQRRKDRTLRPWESFKNSESKSIAASKQRPASKKRDESGRDLTQIIRNRARQLFGEGLM